MERFIDQLLKEKDIKIPREEFVQNKETLEPNNPLVVVSVTLGKELHAGHLFLISVAEQTSSALSQIEPIVLINNNMGPRPAGAVISMANTNCISILEAATLMDRGAFSKEEIVHAYRNRSTNEADLQIANEVLIDNGFDIFSKIKEETQNVLDQSGFNAKVVSESELRKVNPQNESISSSPWQGSGFMPITNEKRVVVLQKAGEPTATGSIFTSISALASEQNIDLVVMVDSMPDASDLAFAFSLTNESKSAIQVPGAGIGFNGEIASGSKGEALTIAQVLEEFSKAQTGVTLRDAALFLTLTRPVSIPKNDSLSITQSFFDFKDNESLIRCLVNCGFEMREFLENTNSALEDLNTKVGAEQSTNSKDAATLLKFLPEKSKSLFSTKPKKALSSSSNHTPIPPDKAQAFIADLGYDTDNPYERGERLLTKRHNFYFTQLGLLLSAMSDINELSQEQFETIKSMVEFLLHKTFKI